MENFDDKEILVGISSNNNLMLQYIYKRFYYLVNSLVLNNGGNEDDCNDIFQEAIIIIYRKLRFGKLELNNSSFETYLLSVCKFLIIKKINPKGQTSIKKLEDSINEELLLDLELQSLTNEKYKVYNKNFQRLNKNEQKLLNLRFDNTSEKEIIKMMGFSGISELNTAFEKAKEHLVQLIKKDKEFKQIDKQLEQYIDSIDSI